MFLHALRFIKLLYPFLREVILGKATLAESYRYDRRRVLVLAVILISLVLNALTVPRLFSLTFEHLKVLKQLEQLPGLEAELKRLQALVPPLPQANGDPIPATRFDYFEYELKDYGPQIYPATAPAAP